MIMENNASRSGLRLHPPNRNFHTLSQRDTAECPPIPRKSSRRSLLGAWPLPALDAPLPTLPPPIFSRQHPLQNELVLKDAADKRPRFEAYTESESDKRSTYSSSRSSDAYSDILKGYFSLETGRSIHSGSSYNEFLERPDTARWLNRTPVELEGSTPTALPAYEPSETPAAASAASISFTIREIVFVVTVCMAQFLSLAGLAQTYAPLTVLSNAFHVSNPGVMAWPTAAYSMALGSCILPAGRLGDLFGHRKIFLVGWAWFSFASLVCGFSTLGGSPMLIACRAFQGIGPALLIPNGLALFGRTFPVGMKRNIAISIFGGSGPCGVMTGAVMSSLLCEMAWWPWSFWAMGIACFCMAILVYVTVPKDSIRVYERVGRWKKFDLCGAITGVGSLVLINFALNQAPIDGWTTIYVGALLAVGVVLLCCFVYIELRVADHPLVPLKGLKIDAALALSCIAAGWGSHGIWSYYLFLLLEQLRGHTALQACSMFWPVVPIGVSAALSVGFLLKRINAAYLMSISMLCFLLSCLFLAIAPGQQDYFPNTLLSIIIAPFGMNWSFPTGVILLSNAVPREHQGIAASLVSTLVNYSISTGLGFAGSIDRYVSEKHGVLAGYRGAWYFGIGLSGLGFVISLYFIWQSRRRKL